MAFAALLLVRLDGGRLRHLMFAQTMTHIATVTSSRYRAVNFLRDDKRGLIFGVIPSCVSASCQRRVTLTGIQIGKI
jgi:hypothetical protein